MSPSRGLWARGALYFHTLRYLKPVQIWGRALFRLRRPKPDWRAPPSVRTVVGSWHPPAARRASLLTSSRFRFLNEDGELASASDWASGKHSTLWLYNLHYFDDLNAADASDRRQWQEALIVRWIAENPPGHGIGWDPYPLSLRVVNWIKWILAGNDVDESVQLSLAIQARFLVGRLEHHLLGNHLFSNAKALVFAGCYFEGDEAARWLHCGMAILRREIPEQILADGGHFERSTMYHALAYEDMLDLANLAATCPTAFVPWREFVDAWPTLIRRMGDWLAAMCHPDGEIAFFNDAATGIAPSPSELFAYAQRLGFAMPEVDMDLVWLKDSGYVRVQQDDAVLIVDVAPVGPDYLPGHAHADTLSYELSIHGQRAVVNSGTSRYGLGPERERQRGTAAHSTLEVDGQNSSEVWAGFRVARRAYPFAISVRQDGQEVVIEASHDGYRRLPGKPVHRRQWVVGVRRLDVHDWVERGFLAAVSYVHLHPKIEFKKVGAGGTANWDEFAVRWQTDCIGAQVRPSVWHPEFGLSVPSHCLAMPLNVDAAKRSCHFSMDWN